MDFSEIKKIDMPNYLCSNEDFQVCRKKSSRQWIVICQKNESGCKNHFVCNKSTSGDWLYFKQSDGDANRGSLIDWLLKVKKITLTEINRLFKNKNLNDLIKKRIQKDNRPTFNSSFVEKLYSQQKFCNENFPNNFFSMQKINLQTQEMLGLKSHEKFTYIPLKSISNTSNFCTWQLNYMKYNKRIKLFNSLFLNDEIIYYKGKRNDSAYIVGDLNSNINNRALYLFEAPLHLIAYSQKFNLNPFEKDKAIAMALCGNPAIDFWNSLIIFIINFKITKIALCFDNDEGGDRFLKKTKTALKDIVELEFKEHRPPIRGKDWYDMV